MLSFGKGVFFISVLQLLTCSIALVAPRNNINESSSLVNGNAVFSRRDTMKQIFAGVASWSLATQPAFAKYSDYSRREKDWEDRNKNKEVAFSSARDLRAQLQEIAPMNTASSKIFCPNGPSANVSPLMENKCGDRLATPSVFGRQDDVMGNSIPGFREGYFSSGASSSMSAQVGGFPSYK